MQHGMMGVFIEYITKSFSPISAGYARSLRILACAFCLSVGVYAVLAFLAPPAYASCGCINSNCSSGDCSAAESYVDANHDDIYDHTTAEFDQDLEAFEDWMIEDFLYDQVMPALGLMVTQMNAVAMQYTQAIGGFLDAKNQMETVRLIQQMKYEAHRDYHPSDDFCWFGTNVRSMAGSSTRGDMNSTVLSKLMLVRQLGLYNTMGYDGVEEDLKGRWGKFVKLYCNPKDNNRVRPGLDPTESDGTGLQLACDHDGPGGSTNTGGSDHERYNKDIDYARLIEEPRTLELDFSDNILSGSGTFGALTSLVGDEEDVLEMSKNLYGHRVLSRELPRSALGDSVAAKQIYFALRGLTAKRGVAQYSFNAIVGLKSRGTSSFAALSDSLASAPPVGVTVGGYTLFPNQAYLAAVVREILPVSNNNTNSPEDCDPTSGPINNFCIYKLIGLRPSYYSQLEIMAKRIYQNPDFYANLYESVANVERKKVAMKAIELMVDREIYESQLRKEMVVSVLLSSKLAPKFRAINSAIGTSDAGKR